MDPKFQTSFIPKRPMSAPVGMAPQRPQFGANRSSGGVGSTAYMLVAVVLFLVSLGGVGGIYAWKQYLLNQKTQLAQTLKEKESQFNPDLITKLKGVNFQIDTAKSLLQNHVALSKIFTIIGALAIEKVRFTSMDVSVPAHLGDGVTVTLTGYGVDLPTVAFQSDVLGELEKYGLRNIVRNPMMTNPSNAVTGIVNFGITATVDPSNLMYYKDFTTSDSTASSTQNI